MYLGEGERRQGGNHCRIHGRSCLEKLCEYFCCIAVDSTESSYIERKRVGVEGDWSVEKVAEKKLDDEREWGVKMLLRTQLYHTLKLSSTL